MTVTLTPTGPGQFSDGYNTYILLSPQVDSSDTPKAKAIQLWADRRRQIFVEKVLEATDKAIKDRLMQEAQVKMEAEWKSGATIAL